MDNVQVATKVLQRCRGDILLIKKREKQVGGNKSMDYDYVQLHLEKVSLRNSDYTDADDYVAEQELVLHGSGHVHSSKGNFPLPQNAYEIPLVGDFNVKENPAGIDLSTERAVYTIRYH